MRPCADGTILEIDMTEYYIRRDVRAHLDVMMQGPGGALALRLRFQFVLPSKKTMMEGYCLARADMLYFEKAYASAYPHWRACSSSRVRCFRSLMNFTDGAPRA
jgi:hypothetical protein